MIKPKNRIDVSTLIDNLPEQGKEMIAANKLDKMRAQCEIIKRDLETQITVHTEEDFEYARAGIRVLLDKSMSAIDRLQELAEDSEHPRAFEVLSNMMRQMGDMYERLMDLQEKRQKVHGLGNKKEESVNNNTTTNIIFSGATNDLQKYLELNDDASAVKELTTSSP